jgi:hypothetical protein
MAKGAVCVDVDQARSDEPSFHIEQIDAGTELVAPHDVEDETVLDDRGKAQGNAARKGYAAIDEGQPFSTAMSAHAPPLTALTRIDGQATAWELGCQPRFGQSYMDMAWLIWSKSDDAKSWNGITVCSHPPGLHPYPVHGGGVRGAVVIR